MHNVMCIDERRDAADAGRLRKAPLIIPGSSKWLILALAPKSFDKNYFIVCLSKVYNFAVEKLEHDILISCVYIQLYERDYQLANMR